MVNNMTPEEERELRDKNLIDLQARADALRKPNSKLSNFERFVAENQFLTSASSSQPRRGNAESFNNLGIVQYFRTPEENAINQKQYDNTSQAIAKYKNILRPTVDSTEIALASPPASPPALPPALPPAAPSSAAPAGPQPGPVIPRALEKSGSSAALAAPGQGTAMSYFKKYEDMMNKGPDMAAMNEYARQRSQGGDLDMLNSLAAAYAGERYAPNQASHLKRAMAARDPLEVSGGMLTNKGFVEDPYAARGERGKAALAIAKELNDSEQLAKREAAADARLGQRLDPDRVGGAEAQQSARRILSVYGPQSDAAQRALSSIPSMREALKTSPDGVFGPTLSAFAKVGAEFGIGSAERAAAASQIADAISKQFGIAKLSEIGGNDTDRELITSIATTYNGSNLREVNNELLKLFETISQKNIRKFNEAQLHARRYGSILRGPEGKTFDDVFDEKERARSGQNNPTATQESASDSISLTSDGQSVFNKYK